MTAFDRHAGILTHGAARRNLLRGLGGLVAAAVAGDASSRRGHAAADKEEVCKRKEKRCRKRCHRKNKKRNVRSDCGFGCSRFCWSVF